MTIITIDFHGFTLEQVQAQLREKMENAYRHDERVIRIIHGQGRHSEFFPVLKSFVRHWLEDSDFARGKIETVYRGEDGSPYTSPNAGETIVVLKGQSDITETEISWEEEERYEAKRNSKRIRAIQNRSYLKRPWR